LREIQRVRCLNCKYDLRHLGEHRCPECGQQFDPGNKETFDSGNWLEYALRVVFFVVLLFSTFVLAAVVLPLLIGMLTHIQTIDWDQ
jgi:hypothetical protein